MGASISTATTEATSSVITESVNQCKKGAVSNEIYLQGITHNPSPSCVNPTFDVSQSAAVDADCFINALQNNLVSNVSKLSNEAQAGIGVALTNSSSINKQALDTKLENLCGGASTSNIISAKDINSRACNMTFVQNATAKAKCKIDALQDAVVKSDIDQQTKATGASLAGLLFGGGVGGAVIMIVVVIIIGVVAWYVWKKYRGQSGGATFTTNDLYDEKNYPTIIILSFLILVAIILTAQKKSKVTKQQVQYPIRNPNNDAYESIQRGTLSNQPSRNTYTQPMYNQPTYNTPNQTYTNDTLYYDNLNHYYDTLI